MTNIVYEAIENLQEIIVCRKPRDLHEEAKGNRPLSWTFGLRLLAVTQSRAF